MSPGLENRLGRLRGPPHFEDKALGPGQARSSRSPSTRTAAAARSPAATSTAARMPRCAAATSTGTTAAATSGASRSRAARRRGFAARASRSRADVVRRGQRRRALRRLARRDDLPADALSAFRTKPRQGQGDPGSPLRQLHVELSEPDPAAGRGGRADRGGASAVAVRADLGGNGSCRRTATRSCAARPPVTPPRSGMPSNSLLLGRIGTVSCASCERSTATVGGCLPRRPGSGQRSWPRSSGSTATTCRSPRCIWRVAALAGDLGFSRPSYEQVRTLVHEHRHRGLAPTAGRILLDVALKTRPPDALLDLLVQPDDPK